MDAASKITEVLVRRGIISRDKSEAAIYEYGLRLILSDMINFTIILLMSCLLQNFVAGIMYIACFLSVRIFCGGFHARTHFHCAVAGIIFYVIFAIVCRIILFVETGILTVGTVISFIPLFLWAPLENVNRPLSNLKRRRNRRRTLVSYPLCCAIALSLIYLGINAGIALLAALWIIAANMTFAHFVQSKH